MNTFRFSRVVGGVGLALLLVLLSAIVFARASFASGSSQSRWAALGYGSGGAGEVTPNAVPRDDDLYFVSLSDSGSVGVSCVDFTSSVPYTPGDVLLHDAIFDCWIPWFSSVNSGLRARSDVNALDDECAPSDPVCNIYLSFAAKTRIPGVGQAWPQDVVSASWVGGTVDSYDNFALYLDGSDVGLTESNESIDALFRFDTQGSDPYPYLGPSAATTAVPERPVCSQLLLVSTAGAYRVPDLWGSDLTGGGEDVLGFCASWLGADTAGYWFLYHDGSAEGLPRNTLIGLHHEAGRKAYSRFDFITKGAFAADSANGSHSEVFRFFGRTGEYSGPTFSFPEQTQVTDKVDSFDVFYTE